MASMKILIIAAALAACVNAGYVWKDDENDVNRNQFKVHMPFQPFAPFPPFGPNSRFPNFPNIPQPRVLTPEDIKNAKPGPNQMFTGSMAQSHSKVVMGPDGKPIKQGGTSILTNLDGKVNQYQDGDAPSLI